MAEARAAAAAAGQRAHAHTRTHRASPVRARAPSPARSPQNKGSVVVSVGPGGFIPQSKFVEVTGRVNADKSVTATEPVIELGAAFDMDAYLELVNLMPAFTAVF